MVAGSSTAHSWVPVDRWAAALTAGLLRWAAAGWLISPLSLTSRGSPSASLLISLCPLTVRLPLRLSDICLSLCTSLCYRRSLLSYLQDASPPLSASSSLLSSSLLRGATRASFRKQAAVGRDAGAPRMSESYARIVCAETYIQRAPAQGLNRPGRPGGWRHLGTGSGAEDC